MCIKYVHGIETFNDNDVTNHHVIFLYFAYFINHPFIACIQYEMIGNSVMEFIHPDDHKELAKQFVVQVPGRVSIKGLGVAKTKDIPTPMTVNFFDDSGMSIAVTIKNTCTGCPEKWLTVLL